MRRPADKVMLAHAVLSKSAEQYVSETKRGHGGYADSQLVPSHEA